MKNLNIFYLYFVYFVRFSKWYRTQFTHGILQECAKACAIKSEVGYLKMTSSLANLTKSLFYPMTSRHSNSREKNCVEAKSSNCQSLLYAEQKLRAKIFGKTLMHLVSTFQQSAVKFLHSLSMFKKL